VYTEDGEIYEAAIISINREYETCVVKYNSYGNVEEQYLKDLMQPFIKKSDKTSKDVDQGHQTVDSPYYPVSDYCTKMYSSTEYKQKDNEILYNLN
jgi:hypothetical protein